MSHYLWCILLVIIAGQALLHGKLPWDGPDVIQRPVPQRQLSGRHGGWTVNYGLRDAPVDRPAQLPEPLYSEVIQLEAAQQPGSRAPCPSDRLLLVDPAPGFDGVLLSLQAGLTIGKQQS